MPQIVTPAIVLHGIDYLESSRIFRLLTRDAGVISVLARGARSSRKRFGSALGLFAQGNAEISFREGRDLQTLTGFDVQDGNASIGSDLVRFTAASAVAETVMRSVIDDPNPSTYELIEGSMSRISSLPPEEVDSEVLRALWRLLDLVGTAPALTSCAICHREIPDTADVLFSHQAGGVICSLCRLQVAGGRRLPASARATLNHWVSGEPAVVEDRSTLRSHQRLFREFLGYHVAGSREPRAYLVWEHGGWGGVGREPPALGPGTA